MSLRPYFNWVGAGNPLWRTLQITFAGGCLGWILGFTVSGLLFLEPYAFIGLVLGAILGIVLGLREKNPLAENRGLHVVISVVLMGLSAAFFGTLFSRNADTYQIATFAGWIGLLVGLFVGILSLVFARRQE